MSNADFVARRKKKESFGKEYVKFPIIVLQKLTAGQLRIYLCFLDQCGEYDRTQCSWRTIADDLGKSERTVRRLAQELTKIGLIREVPVPGSRGRTAKIAVPPREVYGDEKSDPFPVAKEAGWPVNVTPEGVDNE